MACFLSRSLANAPAPSPMHGGYADAAIIIYIAVFFEQVDLY